MFQLPRSLSYKYGLYNNIDTISTMETERLYCCIVSPGVSTP